MLRTAPAKMMFNSQAGLILQLGDDCHVLSPLLNRLTQQAKSAVGRTIEHGAPLCEAFCIRIADQLDVHQRSGSIGRYNAYVWYGVYFGQAVESLTPWDNQRSHISRHKLKSDGIAGGIQKVAGYRVAENKIFERHESPRWQVQHQIILLAPVAAKHEK